MSGSADSLLQDLLTLSGTSREVEEFEPPPRGSCIRGGASPPRMQEPRNSLRSPAGGVRLCRGHRGRRGRRSITFSSAASRFAGRSAGFCCGRRALYRREDGRVFESGADGLRGSGPPPETRSEKSPQPLVQMSRSAGACGAFAARGAKGVRAPTCSCCCAAFDGAPLSFAVVMMPGSGQEAALRDGRHARDTPRCGRAGGLRAGGVKAAEEEARAAPTGETRRRSRGGARLSFKRAMRVSA